MDFQQMVLTLQKFWSEQDCILAQPYDMVKPESFSVKGAALMELEQILHRYLVYQTEQPINSLSFIRQIAGGK